MLREGLAVEEISRRLGVPRGSIIAVKAHVKMGTYEDEPVEKVLEEAVETTFGLERDLQRALRSNIEQLEQGLKITDGGREQTVESGRIDIIAEDRNGITVVIELKAGAADREAVGQILSYMGDLSAARAVPNLKLKRYNFKFSFEEVGGA